MSVYEIGEDEMRSRPSGIILAHYLRPAKHLKTDIGSQT